MITIKNELLLLSLSEILKVFFYKMQIGEFYHEQEGGCAKKFILFYLKKKNPNLISFSK